MNENAPLLMLTLEVRVEHDVMLCRRRARQLAAALGFDSQGQTRIATAVSEIGRNAFEYAGGGKVEFGVETLRRKVGRNRETEQSFVITVRDRGPGIASRAAGEKRPHGGLGLGLPGAQRLMDSVEISTAPGNTVIVMRKALPPRSEPLAPPQLLTMVDRIMAEPSSNPLEELQFQNQELIHTLDELRARQEDLTRVNQELADTNVGVLALYDELETLHRVGVMLASQLSLQALLQAIIDVTTDLTNAQFGAFFLRDDPTGGWLLSATSGPASAALEDLPVSHDPDFFGDEFAAETILRAADLSASTQSCCASNFARALDEKILLKSCLTIPVASGSAVLGALVFGSVESRVFTERSERIVASIAAQAVVGIEKARLFEKVQSASAAKDRFLATLSHELRTPLNPVLAILSSLTDDQRLPPDVKQDLGVALRNVRLEARLIDDLLDFSRIISGKLPLHKEALNLHTLIQDVVSICAADITTAGHCVTLDLAAARSVVMGDSARLQQVLWNVLKNAIKFTPKEGKISVDARLSEDQTAICVTVTDTGRGIDAATLPRIFGAFEQGGPQVPVQYGGLGMGLAIARAFVDLHGGTISAASEGVGKGAQITVCLPLFQGKIPSAMTTGTSPAKDSASPTGTILLVDDHADTLRSLDRLLTRRGHRILTAMSGEEAIKIADAQPLDLIVSDLGLPDGSGLALLPKLRKTRRTPAIALSGYGMEEDITQSRAAGYDEHLVKPVDFSLLMRTIGDLLARNASASS